MNIVNYLFDVGHKEKGVVAPKRASGFSYQSAKFRFSISRRLQLYKKIQSKLKSGLDLMTCLSEIHRVYAKSKPNHYLVTVLGDVIISIEDGNKFYKALQRWAPAGETMLVQAGEASNRDNAIQMAIENLIRTTESILAIKKSIIATLSYPAVLIIAFLAIVIYFSTTIIPQISEFSEPDQWSFETKAYYDFVNFVGSYYFYLVIGLIGLSVVITYSLSNFTHPYRILLDRIPPWSMYRQIQGAILLNAVSGLMSSGLDMMSALKELSLQSTSYMRMHIKRMVKEISAGESPGDAMNTGLFGFDTTMDLIIYGRTKDFSSAMDELSKNTIGYVINNTSAIGKSVNFVVISLLASFIILSLVSMWEMVGSSGSIQV